MSASTSTHRLRAGVAVRARAVPVLAAGLLLAVPAFAAVHTALRRAQPADGSVVSAVPDSIVLEYTERIELATARVILRDAANEPVELSPLRHADSTRRVIAADVVGPVHPGSHAVEWTVLGTDGHPVRGTVRFTVDSAASGLAAAVDSLPAEAAPDTFARAPAPRGDEAFFRTMALAAGVVRFLTFAVILGLIGVAAMGAIVLPRAAGLDTSAREALMRRARHFGVGCAGALLLLAGLRLVLQAATLGGGSLEGDLVASLVGRTTWGYAWLIQVAAAAAAWVLLRRERTGAAFSVACVAIALSASLSGHPVATPGRAALAVGLDTAHVLAAGTWVGSLAVLVVAGIPAAAALAPPVRGAAVREVFGAFSPLALVSVVLLVVAGVLGALLQLGGLSALWVSDYGRVLLVKIGIVALVLAAAVYNRQRMLPRLGSDDAAARMRGTAGLELALAVAVLVVTAVLTVTTPPVSQ